MKFFCSQCRAEKEIEIFEEFRTKTNQRMGKTKCPTCEMALYRRLDTDYDLGDIGEEKAE